MLKKLQVRYKKVQSIFNVMWLKLLGAQISSGAVIFGMTQVYNAQNLIIGKGVFINDNFWCNAKGGVIIGAEVIFGPSVIIHSSNHNFEDEKLPIKYQGHTDKPVRIEPNVWVGARVTILPGVSICSRVVLAAGAVVTASIVAPGVYGGVPAKLIKNLRC